MMKIFKVAICVQRGNVQATLYVGDAIMVEGEARLVIEWDSPEKHTPSKWLRLEPTLLDRCHQEAEQMQADWVYRVTMPVVETRAEAEALSPLACLVKRRH